MKNDISVKNGIIIPDNELEITTSRSGGAGGQHVNKTDTKITVRWNVLQTKALSEEQKERVLQNLQTRLTENGDLIINNSETRSQQQNKQNALTNLAGIIKKALYIPKKRMKTKATKSSKEARLKSKTYHSKIKQLRSKLDY